MIVIPTRFTNPGLWPLLEACKRVAPVVLVHTEPGHDEVRGVFNVHDYTRSIQAWWNTGLNWCGEKALVLNDDITATPEALRALLDALDSNDVVYLPGRTGTTPLTGWCFGIRPNEILPDEAFVWWYGEDDLFRRAVREGLRIKVLDVAVTHERGDNPLIPPEFREAVRADRRLYVSRWRCSP